ncbi:MAG TPA: prolyl oligopeptidase family serine peptidase [Streptosporangiaceae bacterium]|nr:prolyl oligopeptidase family serine peptidase [Streptosporangiaceae bacterium]
MQPSYPAAPRQDVVDIIHGQHVPDPYRWLEDADSPQTQDWLRAQDELYARYLAGLPRRDALAARLSELLSAGDVAPPAWRGERQFYTRREPGQEHAVLYTAAPGEGERALIDPMSIDPSGATTLDYWRPSNDGALLAYQLSEGGTEEAVLRIVDVGSGDLVDGPIDRCKYSDLAWMPDCKSFYYGRRLAPGDVPPGEEQFHRRVYLHRLGADPDQDTVILGDGLDKLNYYGVAVSRDGRWLSITASAGTAPRTDVWVADLSEGDPAAPRLQVLQQNVDANTLPRAGRDGRFYVFTDRDAPRGRIAVADPADPSFPRYESWRDLVAEDPEAVLTGFAILDGPGMGEHPVLLASRSRHAISEIAVHALATGERTGTVTLPGLGTTGGISERPEGGHEAWFGYTSHASPVRVLHYDATSGETEVWQRSPGTVSLPQVTAEQVQYESADGTTIRMLVLSSASHEAGAPRPAILYGYGGFNVSLTPAYSPSILAWVEAGGVYAIAGLRGGGEEGEQWHRAGMRAHKQNVFDDFHAAAEKLISDGWTTSRQLVVWGGSNGGLLVGATVTQRPDLCAAAVCSAPLLDMIRYELFGLGETWNDEYGTVADAEEFGWVRGYSPYHHVRDGIRYPAVLFTVFDGDSRVDPLHARKLCAALQYATASPAQERPVLLRRESNVGHGARAVSRTVGLSAQTLAFAAAQTGLRL